MHNPYSGMADFEWRARVPARPSVFLYSNSEKPPTDVPELMRRLSAAGLKLPARFSCRVEDVATVGARRSIACRGAVASEIRVSGPLGRINIGDVVSAPLVDVKRDPDGVLFKDVASKTPLWTVDADGSTVTVDVAASCPTADEILVAGGVSPTPSASASAPEASSAAPTPAAAPKAACQQCFFNVRCNLLQSGGGGRCCRPIENPFDCPEDLPPSL